EPAVIVAVRAEHLEDQIDVGQAGQQVTAVDRMRCDNRVREGDRKLLVHDLLCRPFSTVPRGGVAPVWFQNPRPAPGAGAMASSSRSIGGVPSPPDRVARRSI